MCKGSKIKNCFSCSNNHSNGLKTFDAWKNDISTLRSTMAASFIGARDPKTTNVNKLKLATSTMMGDGINILYMVNSRTNKSALSYSISLTN